MRTLTILFIILSVCHTYAQKTIRALFIGNSYTYVNNLPQMIADMALSAGDTLLFDSSTPGGYTLQMHRNNATTLVKIAQGNWDYVILQAQSQEPSFSPGQVATDVLPYARQLDSLIHAADTCAETLFYMTWGRKNGDASNCAFYTPVCTYAGMQERLRQSYLLMAQQNNAGISPVGCIWREIRNLNPSFDLYQADESHPSLWGSYAAACSFYKMMFGKSLNTITYTSGLPAPDAQLIRTTADLFFSDSLSHYAQYGHTPFAGFSFTHTNGQVDFSNTSINAENYYWDFGNGNTSTATNPSETFVSAGTYTVQLHAFSGCMETSATAVINISTIGTKEGYASAITFSTDGKSISVKTDEDAVLRVFTIEGHKVYEAGILRNTTHTTEAFTGGMYIVEILYKNNSIRKKVVLQP